MAHVYAMYGISMLSLMVSLVALLKQKSGINEAGSQPTELEIPFFGKLKTCYPALIFAALGMALAYATFHEAYPPPQVTWRISGSLEHPEGKKIGWGEGHFSTFPVTAEVAVIEDKGPFTMFTIDIDIDAGKSPEDIVTTLYYNHNDAFRAIEVADEFQGFEQGEESLIKAVTETTWNLKPIVVVPSISEEQES